MVCAICNIRHLSGSRRRGEINRLTDGRSAAPANKTRAILLLSFIVLSWIAFLFIESTRPPAKFMGLIPQLDKAAHFGAFGILGLLLCGLSLKLRPRPSIPLFSMPLLVVTLCGVIEESIQMFVPGRMASVPDLLADMGGAVFAIWLANLVLRQGKMMRFDNIGGI